MPTGSTSEQEARAPAAASVAVVALAALLALEALLVIALCSGLAPVEALAREGAPVRLLQIAAGVSVPLGAALAALALRTIRGAARAEEDAQASRDEFVSLAAHELRTPLTAVLLDIAVAARQARQRQAMVPALGRAEGAARRLSDVVAQLLAAARAADEDALALEDVDLAEVARGAVDHRRELFRQARCEVSIRADRPVTGRWDRARVHRALAALLANAAKFGAGQPIEIAVEGDAERARLVVSDRGIGVPPGRRERIFERYGRAVSARNYGGLGLGLWVARRDALALGGTVRVRSRSGGGAVFTLELPRFPAAAALRRAASA